MPAPLTPLVGCDVFTADNGGKVLLVRRADNGFWALPGGAVELSETPAECAVRECREETGLDVTIARLLGVFSSLRYLESNYPFKGRVYCHILFQAEVIGGQMVTSTQETRDLGWFCQDAMPPLSDGHEVRVGVGFEALRNASVLPYFE